MHESNRQKGGGSKWTLNAAHDHSGGGVGVSKQLLMTPTMRACSCCCALHASLIFNCFSVGIGSFGKEWVSIILAERCENDSCTEAGE